MKSLQMFSGWGYLLVPPAFKIKTGILITEDRVILRIGKGHPDHIAGVRELSGEDIAEITRSSGLTAEFIVITRTDGEIIRLAVPGKRG